MLKAIDLANAKAEGYGFQIEMVHEVVEQGGQVVEVPIRFVDRVAGKSKMSIFIVIEALWLVTWWGCLRMGRTFSGRRSTTGKHPEATHLDVLQ
jgi:dolichol-phosphate mannosyltransferase